MPRALVIVALVAFVTVQIGRSIRYSVGQLARHHPRAATHIARAVRTGTYCVYEPDPMMPIIWET